jgi:hypothetical protein
VWVPACAEVALISLADEPIDIPARSTESAVSSARQLGGVPFLRAGDWGGRDLFELRDR